MQILTDAGADLVVAQRKGLTIHAVPLTLTLDGRTYRSGLDIDAHLLPVGDIAPVLGAHTGPGLVGICAAPLAVFDKIPGMA